MARPGFAAARTALPRFFRSLFTKNLPYKGVALFLSLVLWFVVERQTPRAQEERVDVLLVLRMDSSLVRVSPLPEVRALISAPAEELLKLETGRMQIVRSFENDAPDSVTVTLGPRDISLPPGVRAKVINVQPRSFVVRFDSLMQKTVPIRSALRIAGGRGVAVAGAARFDPDRVNIVGRRQIVADIQSVSTEERDIVVNDSSAIRVRLLPPASGVDVVPQETSVRIPIIRTQSP